MKLTTARQIGKRDNYPGYTTLIKCSQRKVRPSWIHWDASKTLSVDEDSSDWLVYLAKWRDKRRNHGGKPAMSPYSNKCNKSILHQPNPDEDGTLISLKDVKTLAQIKVIKLDARIKENKIKKEQKILIERNLAEFMYFGYIDKLNSDLLKFPKKVTPRIRNLCTENDPDEIIKLIKREITVAIKEVKKQQKADLENWLEENEQ